MVNRYNISAWTSALLVWFAGNAKALRRETSNRRSFTLFFVSCCELFFDYMELSLLWNGFKGFAQRVGRRTARTPLLLYYVLKSDKTTTRDKAVIYVALGYLLLPFDIMPIRKFGVFGWTDEFLSINVVFDRMQKYITPAMYADAERQLDEWLK